MLTLGIIKHFVSSHDELAYLVLILGVIVEGEIAVIFAGIFSNLGSINIFISFIAVMIGGGIRSVLGYSIGSYLQKHHSHREILARSEQRVHYFLPHFDEKPFWSIFVSRFLILGLHWFSMIFSGYKQIKVRLYAEAELSSLMIWSVVMLFLGYFFSATALSVSHDIRKFVSLIFIFFITFFIIEKIVAFVIELSSTGKKVVKDLIDSN
ncbi:MAG: VTT domain-containing protein [bacterium]